MKLPRRDRSPPNPTNEDPVKESKGAIAILPAPNRSPVKFFRNEDAARAFEYFCSNSIPQTNRLVDSSFWSQVVLQLAHNEPAVKSSVLSLGSLQRNFELKQDHDKSLAMSYYGQAVREAQDLVLRSAVTKDYTNVLVCAILFHCIEAGVGNHASSRTHLRSGLRLLSENTQLYHDQTNPISNTLRRLDFLAITLWDASAPYEFSAETESRLRALPPPPKRFASLNEAANILMDYMHRIFYLHDFYLGRQQAEPCANTYFSQLDQCREHLEIWNHRFEQFKTKHGTYESAFRQKCTLLTIYQIASMQLARQDAMGPEKKWDFFLSDFVRILDLAEEFTKADSTVFSRGVASMELGIVIPLYQTAVRCRDPYQRRRAIKLLRSAHRKEGVWDSYGAAACAECIIELEEEGLGKVERASDVPEKSRVYFVDPDLDITGRTVYITMYRQPHISSSTISGSDLAWETHKRVVRF